MNRESFNIMADEKLRKFVEEAQDLLDANPGSHLTLHQVADDRSEKKIARYDNEKGWPDSWLEEVVDNLLETEGHARLRLRRWLKGGIGQGSYAFEAGEVSAPAEKTPPDVVPVAAPPAQAPPVTEEPPPVIAAADDRLAGLEAKLSQMSMAVSGMGSQPPDYRLAMAVERAQAAAQQAQGMAGEVRDRLERREEQLRIALTELVTLKGELVTLKAKDAAAWKQLDALEERVETVHDLVMHAINAIISIAQPPE